MKVSRSYYKPTQTQRAEVKACAEMFRQRLSQRRREREAFVQFQRIGFDAEAARELASIHGALTCCPR